MHLVRPNHRPRPTDECTWGFDCNCVLNLQASVRSGRPTTWSSGSASPQSHPRRTEPTEGRQGLFPDKKGPGRQESGRWRARSSVPRPPTGASRVPLGNGVREALLKGSTPEASSSEGPQLCPRTKEAQRSWCQGGEPRTPQEDGKSQGERALGAPGLDLGPEPAVGGSGGSAAAGWAL